MQFPRNSLSLFIKCVTHHKRDGGVVHLNMKLGDEFGSGNEGRDAIVKHLISDLSETPEQNHAVGCLFGPLPSIRIRIGNVIYTMGTEPTTKNELHFA